MGLMGLMGHCRFIEWRTLSGLRSLRTAWTSRNLCLWIWATKQLRGKVCKCNVAMFIDPMDAMGFMNNGTPNKGMKPTASQLPQLPERSCQNRLHGGLALNIQAQLRRPEALVCEADVHQTEVVQRKLWQMCGRSWRGSQQVPSLQTQPRAIPLRVSARHPEQVQRHFRGRDVVASPGCSNRTQSEPTADVEDPKRTSTKRLQGLPGKALPGNFAISSAGCP